MKILGISAYYHDSAAALVIDGHIAAAAQEERFSRKKHDPRFPRNAVKYCLDSTATAINELDGIVFYDKPFLKFERLIETYLSFAPKGVRSFSMAMPVWMREKLFQKALLERELKNLGAARDVGRRILFTEHHMSHAASAFFPSPYNEAAILTMDGVGEWATTAAGTGRGNTITLDRELHFPHSLGLLYAAFTYYTGFKVNSGEYKVMGLAPYGRPKHVKTIMDNLIDVKPDGTFRMNMKYFDYCTGLRMTSRRFEKLFGLPVRSPEQKLTQDHMDFAASIQAVTEEIVLRLTRTLAAETGMRNLCLAGGVALNCVANGKILRDGRFDNIWIQPAAGDAGGALGAALAGWHVFHGMPRTASGAKDAMQGAYLGPEYPQSDIERRLRAIGAKFDVVSEEEIISFCASALAGGKAIGWFQGRMEFGPRALGSRSIIADARSRTMQSVLNLKVKYRESFRPFAPSVLREDMADWFEMDCDSPYMLLVGDVVKKRRLAMTEEQKSLFGIEKLNIPRSDIPAVTHVDYSARVQTVHKDTNPRYHAVISRFKSLTGCPVIVNTSFNVRGEPIVCSPEDAFKCFMGTEIEILAVGNCLLKKECQDEKLRLDYKNAFELD
ncbi:MAG: hypothetical protein A2583_11195 [Bdellovibrionales bacterium RIFOXYD1_FULL_53_11]|nr:MAG: hypothetical protein A2583_11195 [Bdellovibrionales bacterium RIFOXYD1_FULL_53_11]